MLLKIAQTFNEQASTGTFVPSSVAIDCHAKPLLAPPKAPRIEASLIIRTSVKCKNTDQSETVAVTNSQLTESAHHH